MVTYRIYKLIDPETNETRYIGFTSKLLGVRLGGHLLKSTNNQEPLSKWIHCLLKRNLFPVIKQIKKVKNRGKALELERKFILKYKKKAKLLNLFYLHTFGKVNLYTYKATHKKTGQVHNFKSLDEAMETLNPTLKIPLKIVNLRAAIFSRPMKNGEYKRQGAGGYYWEKYPKEEIQEIL
jgi:hypothetical protein